MAEPNEDFVSFEKALRDLKMQSEELKKLVSEGEIRAFRDGQSMKFRREDVESLVTRRGGDEMLFGEELEDDTGMVTEELSEEETLLAEEDLVEEPGAATERRRAAAEGRPRARAAEVEEQAEPRWVTVAAMVSALIALYGFLVIYAIAVEQAPNGITGIFAKS